LGIGKLKLFVHLAALMPLVWLVADYLGDNLSANPIQAIELRTGKAALVLLTLSLACTPLNTYFRFRPTLKVRRALGLYAFLYIGLHFLTFIGLDYGFDLSLLREAIFEKPYALVGFTTGLLLLPLAITSTRGWMKRLGKSWKRLHRIIYLAAPLAVVHYLWLVKSDTRQPWAFGAIIALLLIVRTSAMKKSFAPRS
jgi:sulfoxide reductase heme-binding subunit YedZ